MPSENVDLDHLELAAEGVASKATDTSARFDAVDGCRLICILAIMVHHSQCVCGFTVFEPFRFSWILVTYFFVLTGFVLTHKYQSMSNMPQYGRYLGSRFARTVPCHLVCLALLCCLNPGPIYDKSKYVPSLLANIFLLQSWVPDINYYLCFNAPAWTLSVDVCLYLVFPLFLIAAKRSRFFLPVLYLMTFARIFVGSYFWHCDLSWLSWVFPPARLFSLGLGICAYNYFQTRGRLSRPVSMALDSFLIAAAVGGIMVLNLVFNSNLHSRGASSSQDPIALLILNSPLFDAYFFLLLLSVTAGQGFLRQLCSWRPLVNLSVISCSLYLIHFSLLVHINALLLRKGVRPENVLLFQGEVYTMIVLCAIAMYHTVENPCRTLINNVCDQYFYGRYGAAMLEPRRQPASVRLSRAAWLTVLCTLSLALVLYLGIRWQIRTAKFDFPPSVDAAQILEFSNNASGVHSVTFADEVNLKYLRFARGQRQQKLITLWQSLPGAGKCELAVHLLDATGNIIAQYDHRLLPASPQSQLVWIDTTLIDSSELARAKSIGLAVTVGGQTVRIFHDKSTGPAQTDWDSHRLILPVPNP